MKLSTAAQMRASDRITIEELGLPGVALMEIAGRGAADHLRELCQRRGLTRPGVRVLCGGGNNGGDGFVIARQLLAWGWEVDVALLSLRARYQGDALINLQLLEKILADHLSPGAGQIFAWGDALERGEPLASLLAQAPARPVVVDALLGTGLTGPARDPYASLIDALNQEPRGLVFSVDIASGLHADTGQAPGPTVRADATSTFGLAKLGQLLEPGRALSGELRVIDIGIPPGVFVRAGVQAEALTRDRAARWLPVRPADGHKGTFGHVLALGGSPGTTGALALCALGAMRSGAGLVTAAGAAQSVQGVPQLYPEIMSLALYQEEEEGYRAQALSRALEGRVLALGPGLGTDTRARELLLHCLREAQGPMVLDADALNLIAQEPEVMRKALRQASDRSDVILTPHPGEFARLCEVETRRILEDSPGWTRRLARETGCVVLCKTATTLIAHPDGRLAVNTTGHSGMGSGGSGDVLTGVIAGMLAQGMEPWPAACLGVYLHGLAAELAGGRELMASQIAHSLGEAARRCNTNP